MGSPTQLIVSLLLLAQSPDSPRVVHRQIPDLTIRTRETFDQPDSSVRTEILYLKGARQRRETIIDWPPAVSATTGKRRTAVATSISQCDEGRIVMLNPDAKTYAISRITDPVDYGRHLFISGHSRERDVPPGAEVTITIDAVDTGERRQIGRYTARHVITTTKTEPGPGASVRPRVDEHDGWYIDLPSASCLEDQPPVTAALIGYVQPAGTRDRVQVKHLGTARTGYPIEQTNRTTEGGVTVTSKLELIEWSDRAIDSSLFDVPIDYRPALPRPHGGYDLERPDTVVNRVEAYWEEFLAWANRLFR